MTERADNKRKKVLIVDDEAGITDSLRLLLKQDFEVLTVSDGEAALAQAEEFNPDLVLLDVLMPKLDGLQTLRQLRERNVQIPVIMLTATNTVRTAVQAMKLGAIDYLSKPFDVEELTSTIVKALDQSLSIGKEKSEIPPRDLPALEADFGQMVGKSPLMQDIFTRVRQVAERDAAVLITGESGTGKELIAKRIHELSKRKDAPFVAINCAAIPESLIESELFGHEKGSFTHAVERRIGHFEAAHGGTLFLDEIGELGLSVQVKLLRFLQEQEFYRVGRSKPIRVNVRVITATNRNLEESILQQKFRQDLFYRINVVNLNVPPLRERYEDIPQLCDYFVRKLTNVYGGRTLSFSESAMQALVAYSWPGNVRELENVVESFMALCPQDEITEEDLPRKIKTLENRESFKPLVLDKSMSFEQAEKIFETEMILKALKKTNFVQTRAADLLGISRRILKYKMDKLGISDQPEGQAAPHDGAK